MFSRTSLIVNHESMGSHQVLSEAIGRNLTSSIDPLTTLPGRDMITERADKLIREDIANMQESETPDSVCRPFTVIYLALDHFDMITRAIGHKSMDLFIQNMAHRLREAADPTDMVARIDDADFVILFRRALSGEAETKYADKLAKEASRAFKNLFRSPVHGKSRKRAFSQNAGGKKESVVNCVRDDRFVDQKTVP